MSWNQARRAGLAILTAASLAAPATAATTAARAGQAGQAVAQRNCAACHAIGRRGESPNAKSPPFRNLYRRYPPGLAWIENALREGLLQTHRAMPRMPMTDQELNALIAYMRSIQGSNREPI